jgi:hypothetical protein
MPAHFLEEVVAGAVDADIAVGSTVVAFNFFSGVIVIRTVVTSTNVMGAVFIGTNVIGTVLLVPLSL